MNLRKRIFPIFLMLLITTAGAGMFAQGVQTATLTGNVTGPDGVAIPGVQVTATSPASIGERTAYTGANGDYIIRGLSPGNYTVRFELAGMQVVESRATLPLGGTTRVDAAMALSVAAEAITVTAEVPSALETTTVGANITKEQVETLPVVRTPTGIADLAGAVTSRTPVAGQLSINGGMAYDNSFLINGVNVQDPIFGSTNNLFIEDSIQETQVLTSGISAEYGSFTGGVLNVITKSGGNEFSGSARGDFTKPEWRDETPWEDGFRGEGVTAAKPTPRKGDMGKVWSGTLGGPIVRERLWFFGAIRDEENTNPYTLPLDGPLQRVITNQRLEGKVTGSIGGHSLQVSYIDNPTDASHEVQAGIAPLTFDAIGLNSSRENDGKVVTYNGVWTNNLFAEARWSEKHFGFRGLGGTLTDIHESPFRTFGSHGVPNSGNFNAPYWDATDPEDRDNTVIYGALSYFLGTAGMGSHDIKAGVEDFTVTRAGGNSQTATDYVFYTGYKHAGGVPVRDANNRLIPVFDPAYSAVGWWIASRGAVSDVTTTAFFINDRWDLNEHFSFNLGIRHEIVDSEATGNIVSVDTTNTVPRLGLSYDPTADGRFKVDVTYSQYAGRYNPAITAENTPVGNPALLYGYYVGPKGEGKDFAPGFDINNYSFEYASVPTANIFMEDGLSAPVQHEFTISGGMQVGQGGYAKLTFVNRDLKGVIEDFVTQETGETHVIFEGVDAGTFDNIEYRNSDEPVREYQAIELQGRYPIRQNWTIDGNYTIQLKNDGNYEGEGGQAFGATPIGDRPEISAYPRVAPEGRLSQYQEHKLRLWSSYTFNFGRFGDLSTGVIYRFDSGRTFSYSAANISRTPELLANNPGYNSAPRMTIFFGDRGIGDFEDSSEFDLTLNYGIPIFKTVEPWLKFDVRNVTNEDTLLTHITTVTADPNSPKDQYGLRTGYIKAATFGRPASSTSYTTPREYLVSAGIRF